MNRTLIYQIGETEQGLRIEQYLRRQGYSRQNLTELKKTGDSDHVVEEKNGHSLVSLRLETGRTHQIRIHMKHLGFPLIGDYLYNPDMEHISRQALHSYRLRFSHPITQEKMDFVAPLPEDMRKVLMI